MLFSICAPKQKGDGISEGLAVAIAPPQHISAGTCWAGAPPLAFTLCSVCWQGSCLVPTGWEKMGHGRHVWIDVRSVWWFLTTSAGCLVGSVRGGSPNKSVLSRMATVGAARVAVPLCQQNGSLLIVAVLVLWASQVGNPPLMWDFFLLACILGQM